MKIKTREEVLKKALAYVNEKFSGNVVVTSIKTEGKWYRVRLSVKDSKGPGARRGFTGRRIPRACWHVHGHFLDKIFELDPAAVVYTLGKKYEADNWKWEDRNIGSITQPLYFSEACYCNK